MAYLEMTNRDLQLLRKFLLPDGNPDVIRNLIEKASSWSGPIMGPRESYIVWSAVVDFTEPP